MFCCQTQTLLELPPKQPVCFLPYIKDTHHLGTGFVSQHKKPKLFFNDLLPPSPPPGCSFIKNTAGAKSVLGCGYPGISACIKKTKGGQTLLWKTLNGLLLLLHLLKITSMTISTSRSLDNPHTGPPTLGSAKVSGGSLSPTGLQRWDFVEPLIPTTVVGTGTHGGD